MPSIPFLIREDVQTVLQRDPAAYTLLEVLLCYPGLHAVWLHRLIHPLWNRGFRLTARVLSQWARWITGVEIHPGASIGRRFFIDHGTGVVIGETTIIHDDVTLYQGVTLGGTGKEGHCKRHPTLMNRVTVGAGAKILGDITIGENATVGASSVVLKDVSAGATMVGVPGQEVARYGQRTYKVTHRSSVIKNIQHMEQELKELRMRLDVYRASAQSGLTDNEGVPVASDLNLGEGIYRSQRDL